MGEIFQGESPSRNKGTLAVTDPPKGFPVPELPEMPNEHSPGLKDMDALRSLWPTIYSWLAINLYMDSSYTLIHFHYITKLKHSLIMKSIGTSNCPV